MNENRQAYNIEDTAKLMTSSKGSSRKLMIILIILAILAVLVIGLFGIRTIREKRYNGQIQIAEKKFVEGEYELAESEYLKAVSMNKRKIKGREGLAYTEAVLEKYEESSSTYTELYEDTKDERYKTAAEETKEHKLPSDPSLRPGNNERNGDPGGNDNGVIPQAASPEESVKVLKECEKQLETDMGIAEASYNVSDTAESDNDKSPTYGIIASKLFNENAKVPVLIVAWCENKGTSAEMLTVKAFTNQGGKAVEVGEHVFRTYLYSDDVDYYGDDDMISKGSHFNIFYKKHDGRTYLVCEEMEYVVGSKSPEFQTIYDLTEGKFEMVKDISVGWSNTQIDGKDIEGAPKGDPESIMFSDDEKAKEEYSKKLESYNEKCKKEIAAIQSAYGLKEGDLSEKIREQTDQGDGLICKMILGRKGRIVSGGLLQ